MMYTVLCCTTSPNWTDGVVTRSSRRTTRSVGCPIGIGRESRDLAGTRPSWLRGLFYLDIVDMGDRALRALGQPAQGVYTVVGGNGCGGVVGPRPQVQMTRCSAQLWPLVSRRNHDVLTNEAPPVTRPV